MIDEALRRDLFRCAARPPRKESYDALVSWLEDRRAKAALSSGKVGLADVMKAAFGDPAVDDKRLEHHVASLRITLNEREVKSWCQPLMFDRRKHLCGLVVRRVGDTFEALLQAVEEPGIIDGVQLGPTVQTDFLRSRPEPPPQQYMELFDRRMRKPNFLFDVVLSEEGGRFFRDQKRYAAVLAEDGEPSAPAEGYRWTHLADMKRAIEATNLVNIFARTCLAILSY